MLAPLLVYLASGVVLLSLPLTPRALRCFVCADCSAAPANTSRALQKTGGSGCYKIPMTTTRGSQVVRSCGQTSCHKSMTFRRDMKVVELVTQVNRGVRPKDWGPYFCCSDDLCNNTSRSYPSWYLLLLALTIFTWISSVSCELRAHSILDTLSYHGRGSEKITP